MISIGYSCELIKKYICRDINKERIIKDYYKLYIECYYGKKFYNYIVLHLYGLI